MVGAGAPACCSVQFLPSQQRTCVQISSAGSETRDTPDAEIVSAALTTSCIERFEGQSQICNGACSAGIHFVSSKTSPGATLAPGGLMTVADERAMPSSSATRSITVCPLLSGFVAVNSLPAPTPETRPMSNQTPPLSSVCRAAVRILPESAAAPPKSGCWRRAAVASKSGSWSGTLLPSRTAFTR